MSGPPGGPGAASGRARRAFIQLRWPLLAAAGATAALLALGPAAASFGPAARERPFAGRSLRPQATPEPLAPEAAAGRILYLRECAWCHGAEGQGNIYGPPLEGTGAASTDFMLRTGRMPIGDPRAEPEPGDPIFSEEEMRQIVAYAEAIFDGPPVPDLDLAAGDLAEGTELYLEHCAACHSSTGVGAALTRGLLAPDLKDSTPVEVAEAIRLGGAGLRTGTMPRFGEETLPDQDVASVARYVLFLQEPRDPGGAGLWHLGPWAEGLAALFLGVPLLVLVIRWIGEKTT